MLSKKERIDAALPILAEWEAHKRTLDAQFDVLRATLGATVEAPLPDAVWRLWDSYTDAVARDLGDVDQWLHWYSAENDMGRKGLEVRSLGGRRKTIKTLRDLARVIYD